MGYDLLIADESGVEIVTLPFYWLARLLAFAAGSAARSITRGRSDIIWRRDSGSHATALRRETGAARKGGRA